MPSVTTYGSGEMPQPADPSPGGRDGTEFARRTEPFRRELLAHCYRLLGSVDDAEDLVQETYLRAWRSYGGFEHRSSLRTWLYQIATNACLTALRHRARRQLPSGLDGPHGPGGPGRPGGSSGGPDGPGGSSGPGGPGEDAEEPGLAATGAGVSWLQPMPDALVTPESGDPEAVAVSRESLRLALIASLQYLPPRQRAVLLLRDVLAFPAAEVAAMLGVTTAAVKSTLQRARARLEEVAPAADRITEPAEPRVRALLDRYIAAFVNADAAGLQRLLRADATLELPPGRAYYTGSDAATHATAGLGSPGDWWMVPVGANGQPAAAAYRRGADGVLRAYGVVVLATVGAAVARITVFIDPGLLAGFGLPPTAPTRNPPRAQPRTQAPPPAWTRTRPRMPTRARTRPRLSDVDPARNARIGLYGWR
jgi:RNA polymerase sigma-70 factor (ECF subfamily)